MWGEKGVKTCANLCDVRNPNLIDFSPSTFHEDALVIGETGPPPIPARSFPTTQLRQPQDGRCHEHLPRRQGRQGPQGTCEERVYTQLVARYRRRPPTLRFFATRGTEAESTACFVIRVWEDAARGDAVLQTPIRSSRGGYADPCVTKSRGFGERSVFARPAKPRPPGRDANH